jgi:acyl carrier protein
MRRVPLSTLPGGLTDDAEIEAEVRRFLDENFPLAGDTAALDRDGSLLEAGVIDSTGVLELIEFLESRFELEIPDADLVPENFDSIGAIVSYVTRGR